MLLPLYLLLVRQFRWVGMSAIVFCFYLGSLRPIFGMRNQAETFWVFRYPFLIQGSLFLHCHSIGDFLTFSHVPIVKSCWSKSDAIWPYQRMDFWVNLDFAKKLRITERGVIMSG